MIIATGHKVVAVTAVRPEEAVGVNSRAQLSVASKIMQHRIQQELMENGVTIVDPDNTWIDARAKIGQDTVIEPFVYIHGEVQDRPRLPDRPVRLPAGRNRDRRRRRARRLHGGQERDRWPTASGPGITAIWATPLSDAT